MARYNTSLTTNSLSGTATISSPLQGAFTELTGTAPYTVTLPSPNLYPGQTQTFYNATSGTITLTTPSGFFSGLGGSGTSNQTIPVNTVVSVISDGTNYVTLSEDGSVLYATDATVTGNLTANGGTISISPQSLTINPNGPGAVNNVNIGASLRGTGAFTTLAANGSTTLTANISSSSTTTGTLVVTGGVGVSGAINSASLTASSITGTIQTAAQPNITAIGPSNAIFVDNSGNTGVNNTNPTKSAKFVVNTQGRLDGGTTQIATGAIVSGPSSSSPSNLFSASTAIFRVHASDQTNNLQFGIGTAAYSYAPWIQGSYDNNSTPGGASAGATNLILQPLGGNVSIGSGVANAKLHIFNRADSGTAPGTPEIRIEHQDINAIGTGGSNGGQINFYNIQRDNTGWTANKIWGEIGWYPSQPTSGVAQVGAKIYAASEGTGGVDTSSYLSFQTTGVNTLNERLRISGNGMITAYGSVRLAPTSTSASLYLGSDADGAGLFRDNTYDIVLKQDNASGNGLYLSGAGNVYIGIDSNNNETDRKFIVGSNAIKPTNELFSVNESGVAYSSNGHSIGDSYSYSQSGNFSAGTWYNITNTTVMTMAGVYICLIYVDTYASGGAIYYHTASTVPFYWWGNNGSSNNVSVQDLPTAYGTGHAWNNQSPPTIRLQQEYGGNGGRTYIQFNPLYNLTGINGTGGKTLIFSFKRIA